MHATTLIDPVRLEQISVLCGTSRPFHKHSVHEKSGTEWACVNVRDYFFAVPLRLRHKLSFGQLTERVYLLIHAKIRQEMKRDVNIAYDELRNWLWADEPPRNWKTLLSQVLESLRYLRVGQCSDGQEIDEFKGSTRIIASLKESPSRKSLEVVIAKGFLGSLEDCGVEEESGVRYDFHDRKKLRELRQDDCLIELYLPSYLGDREICGSLSSSQKLLLQFVLRELTFERHKTSGRHTLDDGARIEAAQVRSFNGKRSIVSPDLDPDIPYVAFGGNGVRKGMGYRIATWQDKAGYPPDEKLKFLKDLASLSRLLGLVVVAIDKEDNWYSLSRVQCWCTVPQRRLQLDKLHLRPYVKADFLSRWNQLFQWDEFIKRAGKTIDGMAVEKLDALDALREHMAREGLKQADVASQLSISKQRVSKMLRSGECSEDVRQRIDKLVSPTSHKQVKTKSVRKSRKRKLAKPSTKPHLELALEFFQQELAIVPMKEGEKRPLVSWKEFQSVRPTREQIIEWWSKWPNAGIGVVLGPVSNLIGVDVDGKEAHKLLRALIGPLPIAPTVKSGNPDPFRYHLYFRYPQGIQAAAKKTPPGSPRLEIRGQGGLLVLPPSVHPSGKKYRWVEGRAFGELPLPDLPPELLSKLTKVSGTSTKKRKRKLRRRAPVDVEFSKLPKSTREFCAGEYAYAQGEWNDRLFRAACDMKARGIRFDNARETLMIGADPRDQESTRIAERTIRSAYSQERTPGRY